MRIASFVSPASAAPPREPPRALSGHVAVRALLQPLRPQRPRPREVARLLQRDAAERVAVVRHRVRRVERRDLPVDARSVRPLLLALVGLARDVERPRPVAVLRVPLDLLAARPQRLQHRDRRGQLVLLVERAPVGVPVAAAGGVGRLRLRQPGAEQRHCAVPLALALERVAAPGQILQRRAAERRGVALSAPRVEPVQPPPVHHPGLRGGAVDERQQRLRRAGRRVGPRRQLLVDRLRL